MSNDLLIKEPAEQTSCEQSSCDDAQAAALAAMPVVSLSSSTDTSQDSDNKDSSTDSMSRKPMSITIDIDDAAAKERRQIEELDFRFLCIDLRILPGYLQFLTCCGGVFFFFLIYGYCQVSICRLCVILECGPMPNVMTALPSIGGATSVQRRKVWLMPDTGVQCSNAAKTRNPMKFAGVPQTTGPTAASGLKFTIL